MDVPVEINDDQQATHRRRSSILKMPKNTIEPCEEMIMSKSIRRVSFASSNFVKPFVADPDKNTIWDTTYEEEIHHTDSTQSSQSSCSKMESTFFKSKSANVTNLTSTMMDITRGAIFEDKENVPLDPRRISIVDYAKKLATNSVVPLYQLPPQKDVFDVNESCSNNVTQIYPHTMEFTCIKPHTPIENEPCEPDMLETDVVDMEFTCQRPDMKLYQSHQSRLAKTTESFASNMEFTCQIPADVTDGDQSCLSNLEFTCQVPPGRIISAKEKLSDSNMDFTCQIQKTQNLSTTSKNTVTSCDMSITGNYSRFENFENDCTSPTNKIITNEKTLKVNSTLQIPTTMNPDANIISPEPANHEQEMSVKEPEFKHQLSETSDVNNQINNSHKDELTENNVIASETAEEAMVNSAVAIVDDKPVIHSELKKGNLCKESKIPLRCSNVIKTESEETSVSCKNVGTDNTSDLITAVPMEISEVNSSSDKEEKSLLQTEDSKLDITCASVVNEDNKFSNFTIHKTPESSFHINLTNISSGVDDTQHLIHCTYTKPNFDSFNLLRFDVSDLKQPNLMKEETMNHVTLPNVTDQSNVNYTCIDDVRNISQSSSDVSLNDFQKNKLVTVNDTYVLKGKSAQKLKSAGEDIFENAVKIDDVPLIVEETKENDPNDSSLGCLNMDECVDIKELIVDKKKRGRETEQTDFEKWLDEFEFTEYNFEIKRVSTIRDKLEKIEKQRAEIRDILEHFKFKPIPIPKDIYGKLSNKDNKNPVKEEIEVAACTELSIEEKIRKHHESSQNSWELEKIDGNFYTFSTLFGTLVFVVEINPVCGRVLGIKTKNQLADNSEPVALYIMKLFLDKFDNHQVKSAIGENYDILSLLDYVQMTMIKLMSLEDDIMKCYTLTIEDNFKAKFKILSTVAIISCEVLVDVSNLDNINYDSIEISTRIGTCDKNEFITLVKTKNPKGFTFFKDFIQCISDYLRIKEKRKVLRKD